MIFLVHLSFEVRLDLLEERLLLRGRYELVDEEERARYFLDEGRTQVGTEE